MLKDIFKPAFILFLICAVVTGALAYVNGITLPIITETQKQAEQDALARVLPGVETFAEPKSAEQLKAQGLNVSDSILNLYEGKKGQEVFGYVAEIATKGYGGAIKMFVGIDKDKNISGVLLVSHNETPGLGSKANEPAFTEQYLGAFPDGSFSVVKGAANADGEIQAISGATISSRGVTQGVNDAMTLIGSLAGGV